MCSSCMIYLEKDFHIDDFVHRGIWTEGLSSHWSHPNTGKKAIGWNWWAKSGEVLQVSTCMSKVRHKLKCHFPPIGSQLTLAKTNCFRKSWMDIKSHADRESPFTELLHMAGTQLHSWCAELLIYGWVRRTKGLGKVICCRGSHR